MIDIVIVDDHQLFAEGVSKALDTLPDIRVIGTLDDGAALPHFLQRHRPDVILMDLEMKETGGLDALRALDGSIPVVIVSMHSGSAEQAEAHRAGAAGFLPKSAPLVDLAAAIRGAAQGQRMRWRDEDERNQILEQYRSPALDPGAESLTDREVEILTLLGQGVSSTEELAERLYISQKTVKNHLASIFSKLAVSDRTQAAVEAIRLGFVRPK